MQNLNNPNPILDSVVEDQDYDPFNPSSREIFDTRVKRGQDHKRWLDSVEKKVRTLSTKK